MRFLGTLVAGAATLATAFAQVRIAFTSVPEAVVVGQPSNITWGGGDDGRPVTISLMKGESRDLQTVSVLTTNGTNGYFIWTPDSSLASGTDYALQITQGQSDINYSGLFAVIGGTGSSTISYSGTSTLVPASRNSTITSMATGASMGTGVPVSRNTTFSSQSLTTTSSVASTSSATSRTTSRSTTASETASQPPATSAPSNGATQLARSLLLLLGVVGVIVSFN